MFSIRKNEGGWCMEREEIFIWVGEDYKEMTKSLLRECDLAGLIGDREKRVGIKPNLVAPISAEEGATTHPEIVAGLVEYLREEGFFHLSILEGSWVGDVTSEAFTVCGYEELRDRYQVPLIDMQKEKGVPIQADGETVLVGAAALDIDFLIGCPVLKGHCQTRVTCALKNLKGLLPNSEKRRFHALGLHRPIALLNAAVPQGFILADNLSSDLDFEDGGNPVVMNRLLAARDPVLLDAYAASLLHYRPEEIPYLALAEQLGVGCADPGKARIRRFGEPEKELPLSRRVVSVVDAVEEVESCSACYGYLIPALAALQREFFGEESGEAGTLSEALGERICIGQGFRGKTGSLGIGSCTRGFQRNLPGCPPLPGQIEEFLREILLEKGVIPKGGCGDV